MSRNYPNLAFDDQTGIKYWNEVYDQNDFSGYCYRQRMNIVLSWLDSMNLPAHAKILDIGCGGGRFIHEAVMRGFDVYGMDNSHGMLIKAIEASGSDQDHNHNLAFIQGDIEALPIKTASFDLVVCLGVVAYLKSERKALESLSRIIKPGGILAISIVNKARLAARFDLPLLFFKLISKMYNEITSGWKKNDSSNKNAPVKTYLIPRFRNSLENANFKVVEYKTVPIKIPTLFGKAVYPQKIGIDIANYFERFSNVPLIESLGGMCVFKASKCT